jgi:hypothetical protein
MSYNKCQALPPWLWIWFIVYIAYFFPNLIKQPQEYYGNFFIYKEAPFSGIEAYLFPFSNVFMLLPSIVLFLGILTVVAPHLRKYYIERKYYLTENYTRIPAIIEIETFIKKYAPDIIIKANFTRFRDESPFVYPLGYHKTAIAIPSKLIKSWHADRAGTEDILLHEIGHYRNGDALILGAGSFFEIVVKYSLTITLLYIIPEILLIIYHNIILFYNYLASLFFTLQIKKDIGTPNLELLAYFIKWIEFLIISRGKYFLLVTLPAQIMSLIAFLFNPLSLFILPIIGIWCEELNADRFMLMSKENDLKTSIKTLGKLEDKKSFKNWLLSQISHPPKTLRCWMALQSCEKKSLLLFLFLFPLACIIQLLFLLIKTLSYYTINYLTGFSNMQEILEKLLNDLITTMHKVSFFWLLFAILILLWPFISVHWVKFFSGLSENSNLENYKEYFLSAVVFICTFIFFYAL